MATKLPYMVTPGTIPKILRKIQEARRPERFNSDFLETVLGWSGGNAQAIIPLLKRMGFLASDGTPSELYDQFRNPDYQKSAVAIGVRSAYKELFDRNEYAYSLTKEKLTGLITEMTGAEQDNVTVKRVVSTFLALKDLADFDAPATNEKVQPIVEAKSQIAPQVATNISSEKSKNVGFNVSYTINLNLPETTNADVFNAIFKALKENLLES